MWFLVLPAAAFSCLVVVLSMPLLKLQNLIANESTHTSLAFPPGQVDKLDAVCLICLFVFRSVAQRLRLKQTFNPSDPTSTSGHVNRGHLVRVPKVTLSMPFEITTQDVHILERAIDADLSHGSNTGNVMLALAAMTEPAMLLLLGKRSCPILPIGAVNVRNRFELLDSEIARKVISRDVRGQIYLESEILEEGRVVKRGLEFDLKVAAWVTASDGHNARKCFFTQTFTMLQFRKTKIQTEPSTSGPVRVDLFSRSEEPLSAIADQSQNKHQSRSTPATTTEVPSQLTMGLNEPALWGQLCKDYNPIHFSSLAARMFGFRGRIAHGNHVLAKALQLLSSHQVRACSDMESTESDRTENWWFTETDSQPTWLEVQFIRPLTIPARLRLRLPAEERKTGLESTKSKGELEIFNGEKIVTRATFGIL